MKTLQVLWDRYLLVHAKPRLKSWRRLESLWEKYVCLHANVLASEFDLALFHAQLGTKHGKVLANRVCSMLNRMYVTSDLTPPKWKRFKEHSRERFLSKREVEKLLRAAKHTKLEDFIKLCLYTGARSGNIRNMQWSQVDFESKTWTIPSGKNGSTQKVHLTKSALQVLRARHKRLTTSFVFPQCLGGKVYVDAPMHRPCRAWKEICKRANLQDLCVHDLRRTLASHCAMRGFNLLTIMKILGHSSLSSVQIYAKIGDDTARNALDEVVGGF